MSLSVLIFSKYSQKCNELIESVKSTGLDFSQLYNLRSLCIDNSKIRNQILSNKNIGLQTVPCLLIVYPNGIIEKYDGVNIINWFKEKINENAPPPPPPQPTPIELPPSPEIKRKAKPADNYVPQSLRSKPPPMLVDNNIPNEGTNLEDLEDIEDEEEEFVTPAIMQREGSTGFKKGKFTGKKPAKGQVPVGSIKSEGSGKVNVSAVLAQAQAHQKSREKQA